MKELNKNRKLWALQMVWLEREFKVSLCYLTYRECLLLTVIIIIILYNIFDDATCHPHVQRKNLYLIGY